jgi:hypothetical protein
LVVTGASDNIEFPPPVTFDMHLGGADLLRSSIKSILTLLASRGLEGALETLAGAWRYVGGEAEQATGVAVSVASVPGPWTCETLGCVSHRVAARSNVAQGFIEADVRYFGEIGIVARIACPVEETFTIAHGVDPISGVEAHADDWSGEIEDARSANGDVTGAYEAALTVIAARAHERERELLSARVLREATHRATGVYPSREPGELFEALVRRLVFEEVALILGRENQTRSAPENIERVQPRKR